MMGVKWRFDPKTQTALPTEHFRDPARDKALAEAERKRAEIISKLPPGKPHPPPVPKPQPPKRTWKGTPSVKILLRNHFSSALQRMSTVAQVVKTSGEASANWVLLKGSPEMVATSSRASPRATTPRTVDSPRRACESSPSRTDHSPPRSLLASRIIATP